MSSDETNSERIGLRAPTPPERQAVGGQPAEGGPPAAATSPPPPPPPGEEQQRGRFINWLFGDESGSDIDQGEPKMVEAESHIEEEPSAIMVGSRLYTALAEINKKLNRVAAGGGDEQRAALARLLKGQDALAKNQELVVRRMDRLYEAIRLVAAELRQILTLAQQAAQRPSAPPPPAVEPPPIEPKLASQSAGGTVTVVGPKAAFLKDPAHIKARRVANAMVSDLEAYNRQKLDESIRLGTTMQALEKGISDMRAAYDRRVPERVRKEYDYLSEALVDLLRRRRREVTGSDRVAPNTPDAEFESAAISSLSHEAVTPLPAPGVPERQSGEVAAVNPNVVLSGRIVGSLLVDMIQLQSQNQETGVLRVIQDDGTTTELYFVDGLIFNCVGPREDGEKAFFEVLQITEGRFEFEKTKNKNIERKIEHETSFLIVEALRRIDEDALNLSQ